MTTKTSVTEATPVPNATPEPVAPAWLDKLAGITPPAAVVPTRKFRLVRAVITDITEDRSDFGYEEVRIWSGMNYVGLSPAAMEFVTPQLLAIDAALPVTLFKDEHGHWIVSQTI